VLSKQDLNHILKHVKFVEFKKQNVFITGGTGFIGKWMMESLLYANDKLGLNMGITVLTRNPIAFSENYPHIANRVNLLQGDIRSFQFPNCQYSYLLHMATDENHRLTVQDASKMYDIITNGTRHTLDFAYSGGVKKTLFMSSGVVLSNEVNAYKEGKKVAEELCADYGRDGLEIKIARGYCFVGAYLPLNKHFAIGNFINDALNKHTIEVKGDGSQVRSYLYMADAVIWFWNILFNGEHLYPYNVGSEDEIKIMDLANIVAKSVKPPLDVNIIGGKSDSMQKYIPVLIKEKELGLKQYIDLPEAIKRTINRNRRNSNGK
jgi:dTDP-glucose 4,6-dehydratase